MLREVPTLWTCESILPDAGVLVEPPHLKVKRCRRCFLFGRQSAGRASLDQRRGERELFFWTAHQVIKLVVTVALTVYLLVSLVSGHDPFPPGLAFWR